MLKKLTIGKRIAFVALTLIIIISVISVWSTTGIWNIVGNAKEVIFGNMLRGEMVQRELGEGFTEIDKSSTSIAELIAEITAASSEQAQGIDQVNVAVAQMDKVTQSNAANSEETASASEELSAQAEELQNTINVLRKMIYGEKEDDTYSFNNSRKPAAKKNLVMPKVSYSSASRPIMPHSSAQHALAAPEKKKNSTHGLID